MKFYKKFSWLLFLNILIASSLYAQASTIHLFDHFKEGWEKQWVERKLTRHGTKYEIATEDTNRVLMASSGNEASGLWRMLDIIPGKSGKISWRWKVEKVFNDEPSERSKMGDDFAARVYVIFESNFVSFKTYALCYVWAAKQPVETTFRSPYAKSVGTIVLQSGKENKGKWVTENRDYIADFREFFGHDPEMVTGVAIMVDTDNTGQKALTYFDDLVLSSTPPQLPKKSQQATIPGN